ncbi:MAG: phosphoenolpyruvate synthase [Rhodothermaceae bacterium]|nr:phosphoenolpyruvate synthase [Rhodothermaceae bacterium]MXX59364.1 phosphoenolpyruvate synthase [Rhodothermaceae bacterium]MYD18264.1 phosphoenolpyruvate synthase [Rhodothermaceae bacterium]MYD57715.1 phosphoenolpyruvate synthase [Rhodothermaceae bacterium]MYI43724.1 phosphoenolpyruvate synthase [Rhodothermaceae bacterium]
MNYVLSHLDGVDLSQMGGKAAALATLAGTGLKIPTWFVIVPDAFEASLSLEQRQTLLQAVDQNEVQTLFDEVLPTPDLMKEVTEQFAALDEEPRYVAVRSSGVQEDGVEHSFAGQFDSFLFVTRENLPGRIVDVWRSGFNERLLAYRSENKLQGLPQAPAVLVQTMVDSEVSGVAFSADPVTGRRSVAVVSGLRGLGTALVGGDADADTWRVQFDGTIHDRNIVAKTLEHRPAPNTHEGVVARDIVEPAASEPALTDKQVAQVAELARCSERHFGRPQDIEWSMRGDEFFLLQSRPITSLAAISDPDGIHAIWDNSNIVESYSGITTPLTFSFALHAYEGVYREFCRLLGVPKASIEANDLTFRRMLGLIRGRIYYNLLNWYRVIALLPGYMFNRRFMEQMMGVRESLPEEVTKATSNATRTARLVDLFRLIRTMAGMVVNQMRLPRMIERFHNRLDAALLPPDPPLEVRRLDQLIADYRELELSLLTRWDAPLINDFFAMIFFGVLGRLTSKWCSEEEDDQSSLQNNLVCNQGGMISAEPAKRIVEMATLVARHEDLIDTLCHSTTAVAVQALHGHEELARLYDDYLDIFGDRCLDELKLESTTLFDDPEPLVRSIGHAAARLARGQLFEAGISSDVRENAEQRVRQALGRNILRRSVFAWVLRNARNRVRDRENLRFERTRLFGRIRRIFLEAGQRFFAEGILDDPRDIFYLELEEIVSYTEGAASCQDLRGLAAVRRSAFERYATLDVPADRFETFGSPYIANRYEPQVAGQTGDDGVSDTSGLRGIGCCPGIVRGQVRVIRDPRGAKLQQGEILVAERTDPGWIMLFPAAAGILVERGSLLSHSAIVAREMGIPAIVSLAGITTRVGTGDWVEMDGARGTVRLDLALDSEPDSDSGGRIVEPVHGTDT